MIYEVAWSRQAVRDIQRLDKSTTRRIVDAVDVFSATGRGDVKKLTNMGGEYRLRVGDWRVRFVLEDELHVLLILRVLPRRNAYK